MTESTEPTKFTRTRTTIIIVSMIVMPLCAVVGVKMPKFLSDKANESAGVTSAETKAKSTPKPAATRKDPIRDRAKVAPLDGAVSLAEAEAGLADRSNPSAMPVFGAASFASHAAAPAPNSDVRAPSGVAQAVALESMTATAPNGSAAPAGYEAAGSIQPLPPLDDPARPATGPATTAAPGDQFTQIQSRLRALGATHYTLETWGAGGNSFRFQCRMAAGHSSDYTRQFEATDTDPLRTMQTVLDEVEAWKAGRLP